MQIHHIWVKPIGHVQIDGRRRCSTWTHVAQSLITGFIIIMLFNAAECRADKVAADVLCVLLSSHSWPCLCPLDHAEWRSRMIRVRRYGGYVIFMITPQRGQNTVTSASDCRRRAHCTAGKNAQKVGCNQVEVTWSFADL